MAFIWRRRSTTIVKLVAFLVAIWFCIAFLVYTDDTRRRASQGGSSGIGSGLGAGGGAGGGGGVPALGDPIALPLRNVPIGEDFGNNGNVIGGAQKEDEADIPPTVGKRKVELEEDKKPRKKAHEVAKAKPQDGEFFYY